MKLGDRIVDGIFLERPNRYLAKVTIDGAEVSAHVPDPGRLPGLMIPGRKVRLIHNPGPKRKTDYTLALVRHGSIWVSVYPVFANALVKDALEKRALPFFSGYQNFSSEVKKGKSRFDFMLEFANGPAFVEVKSVSLVEDTVAPTERGVKHLKELIELRKEGVRAAVLFVSQRSDTQSIVPNDDIDPEFGKWLRKAHLQGVELLGCNCKVTASSISLNQPVEVVLRH
jgi:sugar fermentation stimulation protein A